MVAEGPYPSRSMTAQVRANGLLTIPIFMAIPFLESPPDPQFPMQTLTGEPASYGTLHDVGMQRAPSTASAARWNILQRPPMNR